MKDYHEIAAEIADLVQVKQEAYGNSFEKATEIIKILYPDGIPVEKYHHMLIIVRILDKISRIATDNDKLGENPFADILGYSLLELQRKEKESENAREQRKQREFNKNYGDFESFNNALQSKLYPDI